MCKTIWDMHSLTPSESNLWSLNICRWPLKIIWVSMWSTRTHSNGSLPVIQPHQRCGYSDSPFARKDTFLYCRVQKWVGRGRRRRVGTHKRKLYLRKRRIFLMEKYIEDARQEEKHVPDPLEAIMRLTDPVTEELRQNLFRMTQFRPEITKIRVWPKS